MSALTVEKKVSLKVAVIGSGAAGMVACHRLTSQPQPQSPTSNSIYNSDFEVTVFEQANAVGGTWIYEERTEEDTNTDNTIHSSMYKNLRTNLPKEMMAFLDFKFPSDGPSYIHREEVLKYLNDYCDHFQLRNYIRFRTRVKRVKPVPSSNGSSVVWKVVVEDLELNCEEEQEFDAVAVCNGHFSVPHYPNLQGLKSFKGTVIHSHNYRIPEPFAGRTVACLGGGPSGYDISIELKNVAKKVFLCLKKRMSFKDPPNVHMKPFPKSCLDNQLLFENGDEDPCTVDDIILCTGYDYVYPFLEDDCGVTVTADNCVIHLYKELFNAKYPTMAFFGLQFAIFPFPLMDIQAQVFRKFLEGTLSLPSTSEIVEDVQRDLQKVLDSGLSLKTFYRKGPNGIQIYLDDLTDFAKVSTPVPRAIFKLYKSFEKIKDLETFRNINYGIAEDDFFVRA